MSNKNPRCRMVAVPKEFMPLLEAELNKKGYFSYPQLMHDILTTYFKDKNRPGSGKITIKEADQWPRE